MEQVYIWLNDQVEELIESYDYCDTDEGRIQVEAAILHLSTAMGNLRRAIRAESVAAEKRYEL